jgi:hypothetical protein
MGGMHTLSPTSSRGCRCYLSCMSYVDILSAAKNPRILASAFPLLLLFFSPAPATKSVPSTQPYLLHVSKYIGTVADSHGAPGATDEQKPTGKPAPLPSSRGEKTNKVVAETPQPMHASSRPLGSTHKPRSNRTETSVNKHSPSTSPSHRRAGPSANHGPPPHHNPAPRPLRHSRRT